MLFVFFSLLSCAISRSKSRRSIWGHLPPSCHLRWRVGLNSTFIHEFWQKTVLSSSFESNNFHFHIWRPLDTFHLRPPLHFFLWNGWATWQCSDTIRIIYLFLKADGRKFYFFLLKCWLLLTAVAGSFIKMLNGFTVFWWSFPVWTGRPI